MDFEEACNQIKDFLKKGIEKKKAEKNGFSQKAFAEQCNISEKTLSAYLTGNRIPKFDSFLIMANALGYKLKDLLEESEGGSFSGLSKSQEIAWAVSILAKNNMFLETTSIPNSYSVTQLCEGNEQKYFLVYSNMKGINTLVDKIKAYAAEGMEKEQLSKAISICSKAIESSPYYSPLTSGCVASEIKHSGQ